jgi:hypothetical protein
LSHGDVADHSFWAQLDQLEEVDDAANGGRGEVGSDVVGESVSEVTYMLESEKIKGRENRGSEVE